MGIKSVPILQWIVILNAQPEKLMILWLRSSQFFIDYTLSMYRFRHNGSHHISNFFNFLQKSSSCQNKRTSAPRARKNCSSPRDALIEFEFWCRLRCQIILMVIAHIFGSHCSLPKWRPTRR